MFSKIKKITSNSGFLIAWILWIIFASVVAIVKYGTLPSSGNVYTIYRDAGVNWKEGLDLYYGNAFLYLPTSAFLFTPFTFLNFELGGVAWRCFNILIFFLGINELSKCSALGNKESRFLFISIISIALSWSAARHGQSTLTMAGLMMLGCACLEKERFYCAAFLLITAVAVKPLAIVLLLLVLVIYPKTILPAVASIVFYFTITLASQDSSYVLDQFSQFPKVLERETIRAQSYQFYQFFTLLRSINLSASLQVEFILRALFALGTLFITWRAARINTNTSISVIIFTLASCYILLFGTGTEANTYALITPIIGITIADAYILNKKLDLKTNWWKNSKLLTPTIVLLLFATARAAYKIYPGTALAMFKPIGTILIAVFFIQTILRHKGAVDNPLRKLT